MKRLYCDESMPMPFEVLHNKLSYNSPEDRAKVVISTPLLTPPVFDVEDFAERKKQRTDLHQLQLKYSNLKEVSNMVDSFETKLFDEKTDSTEAKNSVIVTLFLAHGLMLLHLSCMQTVMRHSKHLVACLQRQQFEELDKDLVKVSAACFVIAYKIHSQGSNPILQFSQIAKGVEHFGDINKQKLSCTGKELSKMEVKILNALHYNLDVLLFQVQDFK